LSLCQVALLRTAIAFGLQQRLDWPCHMPRQSGMAAFLRLVPLWDQFAPAVAQTQVYTLFVLNVLELRHHRRSRDVSWNFAPQEMEFSPAWRIDGGRDLGWTLRVRARADLELARRVLRRYAGRVLEGRFDEQERGIWIDADRKVPQRVSGVQLRGPALRLRHPQMAFDFAAWAMP
jgi:hypothetical protein